MNEEIFEEQETDSLYPIREEKLLLAFAATKAGIVETRAVELTAQVDRAIEADCLPEHIAQALAFAKENLLNALKEG